MVSPTGYKKNGPNQQIYGYFSQEQKERETRAKHEDQQLKKEMTRIRKEMHEDRRKKEEEIKM